MAQIILWLMLIVPWLSLFFLKTYSIKRFMPVAIFTSLLVTIVFELAYTFDWWTVIKDVVPWEHITSIPLIYGAFLPGTIWIFHFTFDRSFWVYIITNVIVDAFYAFVLLTVLIRFFDIYKLEKMSEFGIFILMIIIAVIIYFYQRWLESIIKKE